MAFKMAPKSPAKMGKYVSPTDMVKADKTRRAGIATKEVAAKKAIQLKERNSKVTAYNSAKQTLRSKDSGVGYQSPFGNPKDNARALISKFEKEDPKTFKSVSAKPAAKKPEVKKTESKPTTVAAKPASGNYEKANKGGALDKLVATRNAAKKGSAEYAAAQNSINEALGSKVRHKVKEAVSNLKAAGVVKSDAPEIKADIKIETPAKKKYVEKKTGEKYASKAAMMKHEKSESKAEMKKEYGKKTPAKMKKC